jgi:predicted PurR-regulated permease PerM
MPRRHQPIQPQPKGPWKTWIAWSVYAGVGVLVVVILATFRAVLLPFVIGAILAYVLAPPVGALARRGFPRLVSVLIVYVAFFSGSFGFFHYLVPKLQDESRRFAKRFQGAPQELAHAFDVAGAWLEGFLGSDADTGDGARTELVRSLSRHGLGPDTWRVETGTAHRPPLLDDLSFRSALAPSSALARTLGLVGADEDLRDEGMEDSQIVATMQGKRIGIEVVESMLEVRQVSEGVYRIAPRRRPVEEGGLAPEDIRRTVRDTMGNAVHEITSGLFAVVMAGSRGLVDILSKGLVYLVVTFMVAAFLLLDLVQIGDWFRGTVPPRYRHLYDDLLGRMDRGFSGVVRGQLLICLINGVLSVVGFFIFVPEYALVLAFFATVMTLIPIFGTIISTVPACLLALSTGGWTAAVAVLGWVLGIHFIEANILNPKIIGASARINPVVIVFVLVAGEHAFGLTGAILAVPVTALTIAVVQFIYARVRPTLMA